MEGWMIPKNMRMPRIQSTFSTVPPVSRYLLDRRMYGRGEILFCEGDSATHLIQIEEGIVKLVKHGYRGKDIIVEICGPGSVMGETSLLDRHPYDSTAITLTPAVTLWEPLTRLVSKITLTPRMLQGLVNSLSVRLRQSQETLQGLAVERVDTRIASLLVKFAEGLGYSSESSSMIPLSRQEIADAVGATAETTIRIISRFIRDGAVQGRNRKLMVTDVNYLKAVACGKYS